MPAPGDATTIPWNFVTQNLVVDERLRKKLREKITQLQRYLKHFPPDAVHLNVALERHARRNLHTARLTLRLPSNILHSAKSAPDVITAFDLAVKALLRELEKLKAGLRHEADWKPKERREKLRREIKSGTFAPLPQPAGQGPQDPAGVVADFLRGHYRSLVRHARRQVQGRVLAGEIRPGAIDPRGIADDVVRLTLSGWKQKPPRRELARLVLPVDPARSPAPGPAAAPRPGALPRRGPARAGGSADRGGLRPRAAARRARTLRGRAA